ncbi:zinc metalloproteinase nas-4-like [Pollicipes pollicipes]|uniref:zinc metalloproteinase nas-4-like n=1 Tax=Pollicipes pollicipes TaxID=41117 RepID=UPI00188506B0|nr:zinc metalloproteinase nas-4-like [Pollicipes pollicipes]
MLSHLLGLVCIYNLFVSITGRQVDIFSQDEKQKCEDARKAFLTSSDRAMRNWKIADVRKLVFEGDMIVTADQKSRWTQTGYLTENTQPLIQEKWASNTVTYTFGTPAPNKALITGAMKEWSSKTCIKFVEGSGNAIKITKGKGCYASLGYQSSGMQMSVSDLCDKGTVVHLLGHVIGIVHQHSRPDRDQFLFIQFHNTALEDVLFLNYKDYDKCPYDYGSVMHYDMFGLSYNGESVFLGKAKGSDGMMLSSAIGQDWSSPSESDAALVNREYGCSAKSCSTKKIKPPKCNQEGLASQRQFERTVTFQSMMTETAKAISCIWKTEVPESLTCSRAAIAVTLSSNPSNDLKRVWFASGCRLFQVEIYDPSADMSYFYCGAQFARKPTKVFVSTARKVYGIAKLYPADWEGFKAAAIGTGSVKFFNIKDFVCAGEINGKCY